jgi:hypothetical protein
MSDAAELAAGFRRLRPVVHRWLARDLAGGPGVEYTRAYADLLFGYAFARLGAADDARLLTAEADAALPAHDPLRRDHLSRTQALVARSLVAMFRYRVDEALAGRPPRPTLPRELRPPTPDSAWPDPPEKAAGYATDQARCRLRTLEPAGHVDPHSDWMRGRAGLEGRVNVLLSDPDGGGLEERVGELLAEADRAEPAERVGHWRRLLPLAALAGEGFRTAALFRVPGVVADAHLRPARELVAHALRQAAAMPHAEYFPPLVDAALAVVAAAVSPAPVAAELGWDCLCWFRRLGAADEAEAFLHRTREVWPAGDPGQAEDARAAAIHAGLLNVVGREAEATARLDAVAAVLRRGRGAVGSIREPRDAAEVATAYARAASTDRAGVDRLVALFPALRPVPDNWTTAQYYSRTHLELVDAMLLAFPAVRGA